MNSSARSILNALRQRSPIVLDVPAGKAYISDSSDPSNGTMAGVIVYDWATNASRRVLSAVPSRSRLG